jgi:type II secretory pathway component PulM
MKAWFAGLERREQIMVGGGGVIAAIIILWGGIWNPISRMHASAQEGFDLWQGALTDLRIVGNQIANGPADTGGCVMNQSAVVVVDQTLNALELNSYVTRRQPTPNGIRVEFEAVPFDDLAVWIGNMSTDFCMEVQAGNLSIASVGGPGRINATLTLERAP